MRRAAGSASAGHAGVHLPSVPEGCVASEGSRLGAFLRSPGLERAPPHGLNLFSMQQLAINGPTPMPQLARDTGG